MGYASFGGQDLGYSMYTNSLMYKISDPLTLRADVSLMYSPFGSLAKNSRADFSGIFLQRADLEYRPSKDFGIHLQFRQLPPSTVNPFTRGYGYPYGFNGLWTDD
jgi:hypothetical protein